MQKRLRELIDSKKSVPQIAQTVGLTDDAVISEIVILLRSGHNITKTHLAHLVGVDEGIFNHIKTLAGPSDLNGLDDIDKIKAKFCTNTKITGHMLQLALNYLRVRQFLEWTKTPYFDPDEDKLINAKLLLENYGDKSKFDFSAIANASQNVVNELPMDGDEFDDDMIDKIFVEWGPEEAKENASTQVEQEEIAEPPVKPPVATASTSKAQPEVALDVSVEEDIDEEMIENIFVDWSQGDEKESKVEALHENNTQEAIPKSPTETVIQASSNVAPPVEAKKSKVTVPRVFVRPKTRVKYCSDSDSEEENQPAAVKPQRSLPNWIAQRPAPAIPTANHENIPKRMKRAKF